MQSFIMHNQVISYQYLLAASVKKVAFDSQDLVAKLLRVEYDSSYIFSVFPDSHIFS